MIYRNNDAVNLGYAVDSDKLYYVTSKNDAYYNSYFFNNGSKSSDFDIMRMAEDTMLDGAIFEDGVEIDSNVVGVDGWSTIWMVDEYDDYKKFNDEGFDKDGYNYANQIFSLSLIQANYSFLKKFC